METGYDFILGTSWSRRFRSTEADWATNTLVLKTKCGQTYRVPFIGTTATPRPDPPPPEPSVPTPPPSITVTSPQQFAHFIRQDDVTFFMVNVTDLLHYDPPCPDAELIPLEPDPPSISMTPISTSVPPPSVESNPPSHADADAEELARYTADLEPAVRDLIREYHDVFPSSFSYAGIPPMRDVEHSIQLVPDYRVHHQATYRLSIPEATELKRQLEELLRLGFINPSNSPWGAPVLIAREAEGTLLLCIDYRGLNRYTVKNNHPMPRFDELFDRLAGNRFFTKIDLRSGYHQICVAAADQLKTAFRSRFGHYEFTVMSFGLTNTPATFQRAMNDICRHILEQYVLVYLDDILVYSRTLEEHLRHLRDVLDRLRRHGFYAKLSKCRFAQHKVNFLGHYVSDQGLHMYDAKITSIAEWPAPTSAKQLRSFLGLTSYYSNFIRGYASPKQTRFASFDVLQVVGSDTASSPVSLRVKLPDYLRQARVHDVYHVSLLRPYRRPSQHFAGRPYERPPPLMVDGYEEFLVSDIIGRRVTDDNPPHVEYLVRWKGYPAEEATWEPLEHFKHGRMLVRAYDHARRAGFTAPPQPTDPPPSPPTEETAEVEPAPSEADLQQQPDASERPQHTRRRPARYDD
ncbi:hypothetical protein CBR_g23875 [Chara braunii]|uniref:Chromo domain-containing protein n=1 Tax=Chara braunii TaxID=69332 RepID=A0A388L545_CHABU|nr:hypothetical protein CBR_g23875 [Chara braunii]|eukprot:GBG77426.1 hypothetical protein CBR_g23875 [Chara braunii]